VAHPVVFALFDDPARAAMAARDLRSLGVARERVSVVARSHDEEGAIARASGASPGSEIEDSPSAGRLGELSAHLIAAIALVMPGVGPIVADGPLAAGLGEAAGHLAGGLARTLEAAGLAGETASAWETQVKSGAVLVGAHVTPAQVSAARDTLAAVGGRDVTAGSWPD
jgi:hypothetical protein